jgi:hypothetical protein
VLGQFVDQNLFGGVGRLVFVPQILAQGLQLGRIFAGQHQLFGIKTVLKGIARRSQFAVRGARPGRVLGVFAVHLGARAWRGGFGHCSTGSGGVPVFRACLRAWRSAWRRSWRAVMVVGGLLIWRLTIAWRGPKSDRGPHRGRG